MNNFVKIYYNLKQEQNRALESMITGTKITGTKNCSVKFTRDFTQCKGCSKQNICKILKKG